ncbi:MAG: hypothetical protein DMG47_10700 [Acidobacteria bacterium]|nr:MAG: hypothetical protein DMG47_10700 [Acidobacteriota bacterium]
MLRVLSLRASALLKLAVLPLLVVSLSNSARAQNKVELFGGYSYLRASVQVGQFGPLGPGTACPPNCGTPPTVRQPVNLNGWDLSLQYKPIPFLGAVGDFSGQYGTLEGARTRVHTFLVGPQVSFPAKISPFAHVLVGAAKESQDATTSGTFFSLGTGTSVAAAAGAGVDMKIFPFVSVRLFQLDYLRTRLHGATQNQPRVSAGIVIHF